MHSSARCSLNKVAFLAFLGALISAPCLAGTMAGSEGATAQINAMSKRQTSTPVVPIKPRMLDFKKLPQARLDGLNVDARSKYDLALKSLDKINYEKAADYLQQAVQAQPDEVYLRFQLVTIAQYLGDTHTGNNPDPNRSGDEGIKYYDVAIENLQAMITSPMLNGREKQRAQGALETIVELRHSIGEREEKRRQAGMEIAKKYSAEAFREQNDRERDKQNREEAVESYVKEVNNPAYTANSSKTRTGNFSQNRSTQSRSGSSSMRSGGGSSMRSSGSSRSGGSRR